METTQFLLAPDKHAALALRRRLAEDGRGLGATAGTWPELLSLLLDSCLTVSSVTDWRDAVTEAAGRVADAFWEESFATAPDETADALAGALAALLTAAGPDQKTVPEVESCPARLQGIMGDLRRLHGETGLSLPGPLQEIRCLLDAGEKAWIRRVTVHRIPDRPLLDPWQVVLVDRINDLSGPLDEDFQGFLADQDVPSEPSMATSALALVQEKLFSEIAGKGSLDNSVQWVGVRDALEEVEVAAQMICRMLEEDDTLVPDDVALLLPADPSYASHLAGVFGRFGIPFAGLETRHTHRRTGREMIHLFLRCQRKPAPAVALAALFSSPLMPWTEDEGRPLVSDALSSKISTEGEGKPESWPAIRRLIRSSPKDVGSLRGRLARFLGIIEEAGAPDDALKEAGEAVGAAMKILAGAVEIPWRDLEQGTRTDGIVEVVAGPMNRGCLPVFHERREPWKRVRHLLVLGFTDGHYPEPPSGIPVLSPEDIRRLTDAGLPISSGERVLGVHRARFERQLTAAADSVTFLVSRFDAAGAQIAASASLGYMARLFLTGKELEPEHLIRWLDDADDTRTVRWHRTPRPRPPVPPREVSSPDLALGRDLLALRVVDGTPAPESPSSLEKLLISPLAWLLYRAKLNPRDWTPPGIDVAIEGSLAHRVFERLFPVESDLPSCEDIRARVPELLRDAVRGKAPHLDAPEYQLELRQLGLQIIEAAEGWREILDAQGAKIAAVELELRGEFHGVPIRGWTDAILESGGGLMVVDYKKSSSKGRWDRMEKGFDTQANLYTMMLGHGTPPEDAAHLHPQLNAGTDIGFLYYTMNDRTVLLGTRDGPDMKGEGIRCAERDVSGEGLRLIRAALDAARAGRIRLARRSEMIRFEKETGITAKYTMENSPLLPLFLIDDEEVTS